MVHIPVLKVDVPDPDISSLIPAAVALAINALAALHAAVHDFLRPLAPDARAEYEAACVAALPREMRKARKRIRERRIEDPDKQSSELEEAGFAFYRRMLRTNWVGHSDEDAEDTAFRGLVTAARPGEELRRAAAGTAAAAAPASAGTFAEAAGASGPDALPGEQQLRTSRAGSGGGAVLPSALHCAMATSAAGGAGVALGVGLVRLALLLAKARGSKRLRRVAAAAAGSQRRVPDATGSGRAKGKGPSASGTPRVRGGASAGRGGSGRSAKK